MPVFILDQICADRLTWTLVDSGDDGHQLTSDFDAQALARFVLDDPESAVPGTGASPDWGQRFRMNAFEVVASLATLRVLPRPVLNVIPNAIGLALTMNLNGTGTVSAANAVCVSG